MNIRQSRLKRGWLGALCLGVVVGASAWLVAPEAAAQQPNRVVLAMEVPTSETNRFWAGGVWHRLGQGLQMLIGHDPLTGEYTTDPIGDGLAESWERSTDGREWTFRLRRGVQFHFGYGEVTSADVVHSYNLSTRPDSRLSTVGLLRGATVTAVDRYTVRFSFDTPQPEFDYANAGRGNLYVYSKTQFDREGEEGYDRRFAGTGFYQYVESSPGRILYRRTENHYSGYTPEFEEMEVRFVGEPATRLAMLLTGEAHVAALPREMQSQAVERGMKIVSSKSAFMQTNLEPNGLYCTSGDEACRPDLPWADVRVREAIMRALNRQEMINVLFEGRAELLWVMGMKQGNEGFDPELIQLAKSKYSYDPQRSRQLLREAGYPQRFDEPVIPLVLTAIVGQPELGTQTELVQQYLEAVGLQTEIREIDHAAMRALGTGRRTYAINPIRNAPVRPSETFFKVWWLPTGSPFSGFESDELVGLVNQLINTQEPAGRDALARQIFRYQVENYTTFPLFQVFSDAVVNPAVVGSWDFPGVTTSGYSHWHLIKAAR